MLNVSKAMTAAAVKQYFQAGDYYFDGYNPPGVWGGDLAKRLGLSGQVEKVAFDRLCDGLDPHTGEQLTAKLVPNRRSANDITISAPKPVSLLYVSTRDERIPALFEQCCDRIMTIMEEDAATRVRINGADEDRKTGNWAYAGFVHFEARPDQHSKLPAPQLHRHHVVFNLSNDPIEQRIKALQIGLVKQNADLYMPLFHNMLAEGMRQLGYGIDRDPKAKVGFGIKGIERDLIDRFSPRRQTILMAKHAIAKAQGITDPERLRRLQAELGVLTRKHKQKDLTRDELWRYWDSQMTAADRAALASAPDHADKGWATTDALALRYAIEHLFERQSVVPEKKLLIEALRYGVGSVSIEGLKEEYNRQGVLLRNGEATTNHVLSQERHIIDFARDGRGTMKPLGTGEIIIPANAVKKPTNDQRNMVRHFQTSRDQMILIRGGAGTGKTEADKWALQGINKPVAMLAPSASASRGVLRDDGFRDANTVATFVRDKAWQDRLKGGIIWVDEAALLAIDDLEKLCDIAKEKDARLVLQGDPKQHRSVARDGNMFHVLREYAGLPVADLKEIMRQENDQHKKAVAAIQDGDIVKGHDIIDKLGWVKQTATEELEKKIAARCWEFMRKDESFIVIGITHKQNAAITAELREKLRAEKRIGTEERSVERLQQVDWTEPERGDLDRYDGSEVIQFTQNTGSFRKGDRVGVGALRGQNIDPKDYAVYSVGEIGLSAGDTIRITAGGKTLDGHRLDNGNKYVLKGFTKEGNLALENGWVIGKDFKHIAHGLVDTSFKAQGQTKLHSIGALTEQNLPGINAAQYYVTLSRSKKTAEIITDLPAEELRAAIQKADSRKSATELMGPASPKPTRKVAGRGWEFIQKIHRGYEQLRDQSSDVIREATRAREPDHAYAR